MNAETVVKDILTAVADALPKLITLFSHVGGKDAFLQAIDGALMVARAQNDRGLDRKHGR